MAVVILGFACSIANAQSSVEKSETSQQVRSGESELERAKAIVTKPGENKPVKPETGRTWGPYSTTTTFEIGYRFVDTDGSYDRYKSDVNVLDGLRVLDYSTDMRAKPGTGLVFDFLKTGITNAGGDAATTYSLRMDKVRAYRFDGNVRVFNYFRVLGPELARGLHDHDLRQNVMDFNLRVFPQRAVRFNAGYARSSAEGPYTPSYSFNKDYFKLNGQARWEANDYRFGIDGTSGRWNFGFEQLYRDFSSDPQITSGVNLGITPDDAGKISFLDRDIPFRAHSLVTRANVNGSVWERLHLVLRGLHSEERMRSPYLESIMGTNSSNVPILSQNLSGSAVAKRPSTIVDAGATFDINKTFSISETFRYTSWRLLGNASTFQRIVTQSGTGPVTTSFSSTLGARVTENTTYWNTVSLDMNFGRKLSANAGWRSLKRDITLDDSFAEGSTAPGTPFVTQESESNDTHAFIGGVRFRPTDKFNFIFDAEHGTNNNAFFRVSPLEYTRFRVRAHYQATDKVFFTGAYTSTDQVNPTPQLENEADLRSYTIAVGWEPKSRVSVDFGYDYHDLFSTADISYFLAGVSKFGTSLYYARINSVYVNARLGLTKRLDALVAYYYIMDRGAPSVVVGPDDFVSAYPLHRHNPEFRLAYRFSNYVTGNLSYRNYSYNERDFNAQDYRANILTTSVRFTF